MFSHFAPRATKFVPAALFIALGGCQSVPPARSASAIPPLTSGATEESRVGRGTRPTNQDAESERRGDAESIAAPRPLISESPSLRVSVTPDLGGSRSSTHPTSDSLDRAAGSKSSLIRQVSAQELLRTARTIEREETSLADRLRLPDALPGSKLPLPQLPVDVLDNPEKLRQAVDALYPELPQLAPSGTPLNSTAEPLDLAALERFALENHPSISQANGDVQAAIGTMIQAGMYPNPSVGYESDTVNTGRTLGNQGVMLTQTIKTAGKLDLKKCSATMSLYNAQFALAKASLSVRSQVRRAYFAVLVSQEQERVAEALAQFTHEVYRVQVDQLRGGQAAPYQPMQLRALAMQARGAILQARNRTDAARRQLAAALGMPDAAPPLARGQVNHPGPRIEFETAVELALQRHTDVLSARNSVHKARYDLRLAEVTPIPDVDIYSAIQKDFTTPPFGTTYNLQVSVPVPVFDRNQGGIRAACGQLVRASEEERRLQTTLTADFARVFERYRTNRDLVELYRDQIIPDQSRAYRGVYEHHQQEPNKVTFGDIVTAQQTLANSINAYLASLNEYWSAVVDLAELLQLEDVFATIPGAWDVSVDVPPEPLP